jgi:hypothetical protein
VARQQHPNLNGVPITCHTQAHAYTYRHTHILTRASRCGPAGQELSSHALV